MLISDVARMVIGLGLLLVVVGVVMLLISKIPGIGHLPGDIIKRSENGQFIFPITTCIVISLILTVVLNLVMHFINHK